MDNLRSENKDQKKETLAIVMWRRNFRNTCRSNLNPLLYYMICILQVICVGQIVCAVAADSYAHAKQAAAKVRIEYEALEPVILTIEVLTSSFLLVFHCFIYLGNGSISLCFSLAFLTCFSKQRRWNWISNCLVCQ